MADGGEILFHFKGDDKELQSTINSVQKSLDSLSTDSLEAIGDSFTKVGGIITATTTAIIGFGASYNAEIESITMSLATLTGSEEEAQKIMEQIKRDAVRTPFDVQSLAKGQQMLMGVGMTADESREAILQLGDAISGGGGTSQDFALMIRNLSGIKGTGKAFTKDMYQFANALIPMGQLLADSMGISVEEVNDLVSKGKIGYDEIVGALAKATSEGGRYYGAMERQSHTLNGMISNLKDNFGALSGTMSSGLTDAVKVVLPYLNEFISKLDNLFSNNVKFQQLSTAMVVFATKISAVLDMMTEEQMNTLVDFMVAIAKTGPIMLGLGAILPKVASGFSMLGGGLGGATSLLGMFLSNIHPVARNCNKRSRKSRAKHTINSWNLHRFNCNSWNNGLC